MHEGSMVLIRCSTAHQPMLRNRECKVVDTNCADGTPDGSHGQHMAQPPTDKQNQDRGNSHGSPTHLDQPPDSVA